MAFRGFYLNNKVNFATNQKVNMMNNEVKKPKIKAFVAKTTDVDFHKHVCLWAIKNDTTVQDMIATFLAGKTAYDPFFSGKNGGVV